MSPEGWTAVQAVCAGLTGLGMAWIALQQARLRVRERESERRHERAEARLHEVETQVAESSRSRAEERAGDF